jgi:hypothetical protein
MIDSFAYKICNLYRSIEGLAAGKRRLVNGSLPIRCGRVSIIVSVMIRSSTRRMEISFYWITCRITLIREPERLQAENKISGICYL